MSPPSPDPRDDRRVVDRLPADLAKDVADQIRITTDDDVEVRLGDPDDRRVALTQEQQAEYPGTVQGPPVSIAPISGAQARGAIVGALGFGAVGLVIGVLIGLIPMFDLPLAARIGLWALVCTMGASAAGFVFGGGREPELEGAMRDTSDDVTVAVVADSPAVRAKALDLMAEADLEAARRAKDLAKDDRAQQPPEPELDDRTDGGGRAEP